MTTTASRKFALGALVIIVVAALCLYLLPYVSLEYLEAQRRNFGQFYAQNPVAVVLLYILVATLLIGAALPVTGVIAILSGALFGFAAGLAATAIASTVGSTIVLLWSRYFFRDFLQARFHREFAVINRGIAQEGGYYIFSIRLMTVFPMFLINLVSGLTDIRLSPYVIATFLSQTIAVSLWVYAGSTIANLRSAKDALSVEMMLVLASLGLFPLICHRIFLAVRRRGGGV